VQIHAKRNLVTNQRRRTARSNATRRVRRLILQLIIHKNIERTIQRVRQIGARKPITKRLLRRSRRTCDVKTFIP